MSTIKPSKMQKENGHFETEILQHRIDWWAAAAAITELDEVSISHIETSIKKGYSQGELNIYWYEGDNLEECRGWWKIITD